VELDEHVWTSPRNAILIVEALTDILAELDEANADYFRANAAAYIAELEALDAAFAEVVAGAVRHTIVFGDRFPFRYLAHEYGLHFYAAFPGCSTETQASPATIARLINLVRDEAIPVIFTIEFSNQQIANVIAEDTGAEILELHSAHNLSFADFDGGVTYLELMWRNVEQLREALS
jgi:zinc transport system substrate-binding protein